MSIGVLEVMSQLISTLWSPSGASGDQPSTMICCPNSATTSPCVVESVWIPSVSGIGAELPPRVCVALKLKQFSGNCSAKGSAQSISAL